MAEMTPDEANEQFIRQELEAGKLVDMGVVGFLISQLDKARAAIDAEREACCLATCPYCDELSHTHKPAVGPDEDGCWTHQRYDGGEPIFCEATAIRARAKQQNPARVGGKMSKGHVGPDEGGPDIVKILSVLFVLGFAGAMLVWTWA